LISARSITRRHGGGTRWLCHEVMPALDPFGLRGPPGAGEYE
jgi:hypothetical protein